MFPALNPSFLQVEGNSGELLEFEITGSTYEPIGDIFLNGQKVKGADFEGLQELATISLMCNDSSVDFNEFKNLFEKVGEATETALVVLAEKINPFGVSKAGQWITRLFQGISYVCIEVL